MLVGCQLPQWAGLHVPEAPPAGSPAGGTPVEMTKPGQGVSGGAFGRIGGPPSGLGRSSTRRSSRTVAGADGIHPQATLLALSHLAA